jgi:hypothetical protein
MKGLVGFLVLAASAAFGATPVDARPPQSDRPTEGYWSCFSGPEDDPIYFTGVWEERALATEVHAAFVKFLADKYGYTGWVSCSTATKGPSDLAKAKASSLELQRHYQQVVGKKVIDTGWTHQQTAATAESKTAPLPGAATAPGAPTHWAACRIDRLPPDAKSLFTGYNIYISDVFPLDPKVTNLVKSYGEFISAKYGPERDNPLCNVRTSEEGVRAMHKTWIDEANKIGKAILTGWTYAPQ